MSALAWLVFAIILLVIEMITPGVFFFACLSAGGFVASLAAVIGAPAWLSWAVFFTSSILLVFLVAPLARRWMKRNPATPVGLDSLKGRSAHVIEAIDPITGKGKVRIQNGAIWNATCEQAIEEGLTVIIDSVIGTRLKVVLGSETTSHQE
jgi:membrane protein implicated in regulation of membrane protease activity